MKTIITHTSPDMDALLSVWLIVRNMDSLLWECQFVPAGTSVPDADAVVDTGGEHDPELLRFDHHQSPTSECAASLVFAFLLERGDDLAHLAPLVELVKKGDTGDASPTTLFSYKLGLHAALTARKLAGFTDDQLLKWSFQEFDLMAVLLQHKAEAYRAAKEHVLWQGGVVAAVSGGGRSVTDALYELGYEVIVFQDEMDDNGQKSFAVGVSRSRNSIIHIADVLKSLPIIGQIEEDRWYLAPTGFFAGRGTAKSPRPDPCPIDIVDLARMIHDAVDNL
jgi:hypothetical protein